MSTSILKRTLALEERENSAKTKQSKQRKQRNKNKSNNKFNSLIDEPKQPQEEDTTTKKIELLRKLSQRKVKVNKIIDHHKGRLSRDQPKEKRARKPEEKSVFTDEDFAKFEAEYFVKGKV